MKQRRAAFVPIRLILEGGAILELISLPASGAHEIVGTGAMTPAHPTTATADFGTRVVDPLAPGAPTPADRVLRWGRRRCDDAARRRPAHVILKDEAIAIRRVKGALVLLHEEAVFQGLAA